MERSSAQCYEWPLTVKGVLRPILVMNGQFPGPLIRVNQGDRVLVNVTNELANATTVHWHSLYQNGTNWMDEGWTLPSDVSGLCNRQ
jgi:FtsP/CotA-like multicopper oxidase with cupredoxin domain